LPSWTSGRYLSYPLNHALTNLSDSDISSLL
jgi:hypothetical protein